MHSAHYLYSHRTSVNWSSWRLYLWPHGIDIGSLVVCVPIFFRERKNARYAMFDILLDYIELRIQMCAHVFFLSRANAILTNLMNGFLMVWGEKNPTTTNKSNRANGLRNGLDIFENKPQTTKWWWWCANTSKWFWLMMRDRVHRTKLNWWWKKWKWMPGHRVFECFLNPFYTIFDMHQSDEIFWISIECVR